MWIPRLLSDALQQAAATRPVVLLTGARQTGKSSLLQRQFNGISYESLDRPLAAQAASESPQHFLDNLGTPLLLDEVQYAPALFREIKPRVDKQRRRYGQYNLTGSQRFELMSGISETLAGRIRILELLPLSAAELRGADLDTADFCWRGGYPELWSGPGLDAREFFEDYVSTYLERDLHRVIQVTSLIEFRRFMQACAARAGQLLNYSDLARDVGISPATAKNWIHALDAGGLIHILPPYFANIGKRLAKAPKLYFADHGLLCHLLGVRSADDWQTHPQRGALWENLVLGELIKTRQTRPGRDLFYYRDQNAVEIDFMIADGQHIELIEAKAAERPDRRKLNFRKVAPRLPAREVTCTVACTVDEGRPIQLGEYRLINPLRHAVA